MSILSMVLIYLGIGLLFGLGLLWYYWGRWDGPETYGDAIEGVILIMGIWPVAFITLLGKGIELLIKYSLDALFDSWGWIKTTTSLDKFLNKEIK